MKFSFYLLIGITGGICGFAAKAALGNDTILQFARDYAPWIAAVAVSSLMVVAAALAAIYLYIRYRLRRLLNVNETLTDTQIAEGLVDILTTPQGISNPTPEERKRAALINAGTWLIKRQAMQFYFNVVVTVLGGLIGSATFFLLYEQNNKLDLQNDKITLQTDANIAESVLLEGSRRAALSSDMAALFQEIRLSADQGTSNCDGEDWTEHFDCWTVDETGAKLYFHLSEDLTARVNAFTERNPPYRVPVSRGQPLDFDLPLRDQMEFPDVSPERGQLLQTLVLAKVYPRKFDLSYAYLPRATLRKRDLLDAVASFADLSGANITHSNMSMMILESANLTLANPGGANLNDINLVSANLTRANLAGASASRARFNGANLTNATLNGLNGDDVGFLDSNLTSSTFIGANLRNSDFRRTNLSGVDFTNARFEDVDFGEAWAWADNPPGAHSAPGLQSVILCDFNNIEHSRDTRPENCN